MRLCREFLINNSNVCGSRLCVGCICSSIITWAKVLYMYVYQISLLPSVTNICEWAIYDERAVWVWSFKIFPSPYVWHLIYKHAGEKYFYIYILRQKMGKWGPVMSSHLYSHRWVSLFRDAVDNQSSRHGRAYCVILHSIELISVNEQDHLCWITLITTIFPPETSL